MAKFGRQSEIYQYAIDHASIVSITDKEGRITFVNQNFCTISGYTKKDLIGKDHRIVNSGFHSSDFFKEMWGTLLHGKSWKGEVCNRAKDGKHYWVQTNITPILNAAGEITEFISIRQDITDSKRIELLFNEESKTLNFFLDSYDAGMFQYFYKEDKFTYDTKFLKILDTTRQKLGKSLDSFLKILSPEDKKSFKKKILIESEKKAENFSFLAHYTNHSSEVKSIMFKGKVIRKDLKGIPEILVGIVTDLTEQMKLENMLLRTQEVAKIGSWEFLTDEKVATWSPSTYDIYGYQPYSFIPTVDDFIENFIVDEFKEFAISLIDKAIETRSMTQGDMQVKKVNGDKIWVRQIVQAEFNENDVFKVYGTTQDINDQKNLEISLQKSMKKVDMALETAGFGIGELHYSKKNLVVDDFLKSLLGLEHIERELTLSDLKTAILPEDFAELNDRYSRAIKEGKAIVDAQFRVVKGDGVIRFIQSRGVIEYTNEGKRNSLIGLFWDITKDKEFENILIETKNKAEEATKMKSAFLASMSHEIRTPMNGVLGMLDLLLDTSLDSEQKKLIETMKVCSDNLLTVVNDVLDFSKIEAGKIEIEKRKFDLIQMMQNLFSFFKVTANKKNIELNLKLDKSLPRYIEMDEVRIKQVLSNLLSNAIKFTSKGHIDILVYSNQPEMDFNSQETINGSISFIVKDTGIGIPREKIPKLFNSFSQVDSSTTRKFGGTGLGLAIAKSLVENMGGEIKVTSKENKGTTFKFNILCPFFKDMGNQTENVKKLVASRKDIKILVAEDNAINQSLIIALFKKIGFHIDLAGNGDMAYNMVKEKEYDIVFMDLQMPIMDGVSATKKIMAEDSLANKPLVVALTANVFEEDKNRCLSAGMSDFLSKPVSRIAIQKILSRYFPDYNSSSQEVELTMEEKTNEYKLINVSQILFEFDEDMDIFEELFKDYQSRFKDMVNQIKTGYEKGSAEEVKIAAHTLKGVVANFYSDELTKAALTMEVSGRNGDLTHILQQLNIFLNYNDGVLAEVFSFLNEQRSKKSSEAA